MPDEPLFKGPSEEEVLEALKTMGVPVARYKGASVVVCGISDQPEQGSGLYPINYSFATYTQDLKRWYPLARTLRDYSDWTDYWTSRAFTDELTELPGVHKERQRYYKPHASPEGWHEFDEYAEKMRAMPHEAFSEEYGRNALDFERRENAPDIAVTAKWYLEGKGTIYREPTGKFWNEEQAKAEGLSRSLVLGQLTKTIRDIIWTLTVSYPGGGHIPFHRIEGEQLHQAIFERLKTAKQLAGLLRFAQQSGIEDGYSDYRVMLVQPDGFDRFFSSVDEALEAVHREFLQTVQQLMAEKAPEESMMVAASFSKEEVKTLVAAADILDRSVPEAAELIDKLISSPQGEVFNEDFRKADFVAALVRVADKLDKSGHREAATVADKLLKSIAESDKLSKKLNI